MMFLFGEILKMKVCEIVVQIGLLNVKKKDLIGICFIGEWLFCDFLNCYLLIKLGLMKMFDGKVVGEYIGFVFYMFGQCKGIGFGGSKSGSGELWFVVVKDIVLNMLYVVQGYDYLWLLLCEFVVGNVSWVVGELLVDGFVCGVKMCYWQVDVVCVFGLVVIGVEVVGLVGEVCFLFVFDDV